MSTRPFVRRSLSLAMTAATLTLAASEPQPSAPAAAPSPSAPLALWDWTARATAGGGYRANVLRTSIAPESSSFVTASGELSALRLSETGSQATLLAMGEHTQYFAASSVHKEQWASASAQGAWPLGAADRLGGWLQYFYQNQVVDVSETEATLRRVLIEGHSFSLRPDWQHSLGPGWRLKFEAGMLRQFYRVTLDDFWEGSGRLSLVREYGRRSEWSVGFQSRHRLYDTRLQYDRQAQPLPGTHLVYWQPELSASWRHHWDAQRHWRTTTRFSVLFNRDNGSGYFDYNRLQWAQQVRWSQGGWDATAQARLGWYGYPVQRLAGERRYRWYCELDLRLERRLGKHALVYAAAGREWDFSNDPLDQYRDWVASAGAGVEF